MEPEMDPQWSPHGRPKEPGRGQERGHAGIAARLATRPGNAGTHQGERPARQGQKVAKAKKEKP